MKNWLEKESESENRHDGEEWMRADKGACDRCDGVCIRYTEREPENAAEAVNKEGRECYAKGEEAGAGDGRGARRREANSVWRIF